MRKTFDEVFEDRTKYGTKVKTDEYKECGAHIIIDQGQEQIAGYTDLEEGLLEEVPAIIFGDHTRVIKYVDEPFFLGADGVKVLRSKYENANYKYLYYALKNANIPNTGYNRHFKWLKEVAIECPDMDKQAEIVDILDRVTAVIEDRKQELQKLEKLIKARFVEMFGDVKTGVYKYETRKLGDVAEVGSSHRVFTSEFVETGVPFYRGTEIGELANGIKPANPYRITEEHYNRLACDESKPKIGDLLMPSICNKGQVWMVDTEEPFYYKDGRVLCISPNRELFNCKFLEQFMREKTMVEYPKLGSGSTFAEFKIFLLKEIDVLIPPIEQQEQFAEFCKQIDKSRFGKYLMRHNYLKV